MAPHFALPLAAFILVAAPGPQAPAPAPQEELGQAEQLASGLGRTIGGAMECNLADRADTAMLKAEDMINQAAVDEGQDGLEMDDRFHEAMADGRQRVLDATTSCDEVETALRKFEGQTRN